MSKFKSRQAAWEYYLNLDSHHFEEKQHNNIHTDAFEAGAEWEHKRLIEMACDWLVMNASDYVVSTTGDDDDCVVSLDMVEDFRKAMEE